jgi:hypothetical protein
VPLDALRPKVDSDGNPMALGVEALSGKKIEHSIGARPVGKAPQ